MALRFDKSLGRCSVGCSFPLTRGFSIPI